MNELKAGDRIRVVQQIDRREENWLARVEGVFEEVLVAPTGSWYAHAPKGAHPLKGRYLLTRIRLRKDDGELSLVSLDEDSRVLLLNRAEQQA